jgi:hypothetical protein
MRAEATHGGGATHHEVGRCILGWRWTSLPHDVKPSAEALARLEEGQARVGFQSR